MRVPALALALVTAPALALALVPQTAVRLGFSLVAKGLWLVYRANFRAVSSPGFVLSSDNAVQLMVFLG